MRVIDADALLSAFESEEDPKESLWTIYGIKRKIEDAPSIITKEEQKMLKKWKDNRGISIDEFEEAIKILQDRCDENSL